jgi:UDP-N-acetylmuramoyl-tripeptide--D-alanyl-D-alanine ligase
LFSSRVRKVGELVSGIANLIITIGPRSRLTAEEVLKSGKLPESVLSFDNSKQAIEDVKGRIGKGDIVLIKGSQAMRMEHIVKAIMDQPSQAKQLLVRQEEEWIRKE